MFFSTNSKCRVLSRALIAFCFLYALAAPFPAHAVPAVWDGVTSTPPETGNGSDASPYIICKAEHLAGMRDWVNSGDHTYATYKLTSDIDLDGNEWVPMHTFRGKFWGNRHTISNFTVVSPDKTSIGFFQYLTGTASAPAEIKELGLVSFDITGRDYTGGLVGYSRNSKITSSFARGKVTGSAGPSAFNSVTGGLVGLNWNGKIELSHADVKVSAGANGQYVGGLVGWSYDTNSAITNSYATGNVTGHAYVGGLVGFSSGGAKTELSYASGDVKGNASYVGGLVGYSSSSAITSCWASGAVQTATTAAGGLVGNSSYSNIFRSYAIGRVSAEGTAGGLVGLSNTYNTSSMARIASSYSTGDVATTRSFTGGLAGSISGSQIVASFATGRVTVSAPSPSNTYVGGLVGQVNSIAGWGINSTPAYIFSSFATGDVILSGGQHVGGIAGQNSGSLISNSYALGNVSGDTYIGGIAGNNALAVISADLIFTAATDTCYAYGNVFSSKKVGGITGWNSIISYQAFNFDASVVSDCNWLKNGSVNPALAAGIGMEGDIFGAIPVGATLTDQATHARSMSDTAMRSASNFQPGWDFSNTWCYTDFDTRAKPHLRAFFDNSDSTNFRVISRDLVTVIPGVVELREGERRSVRFSAMGGLGYGMTDVSLSPYRADSYATLTADLSGLITLSADAPFTTGNKEYTITVNSKVTGYPQIPQTFLLRLIPTPSDGCPVPPPTDPGGGGDGGGGGGGGSSPSLVIESQPKPITPSNGKDSLIEIPIFGSSSDGSPTMPQDVVITPPSNWGETGLDYAFRDGKIIVLGQPATGGEYTFIVSAVVDGVRVTTTFVLSVVAADMLHVTVVSVNAQDWNGKEKTIVTANNRGEAKETATYVEIKTRWRPGMSIDYYDTTSNLTVYAPGLAGVSAWLEDAAGNPLISVDVVSGDRPKQPDVAAKSPPMEDENVRYLVLSGMTTRNGKALDIAVNALTYTDHTAKRYIQDFAPPIRFQYGKNMTVLSPDTTVPDDKGVGENSGKGGCNASLGAWTLAAVLLPLARRKHRPGPA